MESREFGMSKSVAVAICTTGERNLIACLESVQQQTVPSGWDLLPTLVIVNQLNLDSELVSKVESGFPNVIVFQEDRLGIPWARNRAQSEALAAGASWVAFLDDDCLADVNWLTELASQADALKSDCVMGEVIYKPTSEPSSYIPERKWHTPFFKSEGLLSGQALLTAYTHSVLYRPLFYNGQSEPLEFDVARSSSGGSDSKYFRKFKELGGQITFCGSSKVIELYSGERLELSWHLLRRLSIITNHPEGLRVAMKGWVVKRKPFWGLKMFLNLPIAFLGLVFCAITGSLVGSRKLNGCAGRYLLALVVPFGILLRVVGIRYDRYSSQFRWEMLERVKIS
jgi:succinoglycan biosynthesis protein ExoM